MTDEQIKEINSSIEDSWNQGIFTNPWGIDSQETRPVIYQRVELGGACGGNCWGTDAEEYTNTNAPSEMENWEALDATLDVIAPNITYLQYKRIVSKLVHSNKKEEYEYYGNYTNYIIRWIPVDDLVDFLEENEVI